MSATADSANNLMRNPGGVSGIKMSATADATATKLAELSGVCKATIYKWVAKFEALKQDYDIRYMKQRKKKTIVIDSDAQKEIARLRKENEALKRQLKTAELDKKAFQTLIKICERDYNVSFTKKGGTKQ